uniref:Fibronectin type-II domain-containing protein n=1 Tax=Ailuropoda melanoleuca TaxID=9646 RepID=A0A7N5P3I4_AILME
MAFSVTFLTYTWVFTALFVGIEWSYCADIRLDANYPIGPCKFPFIFENKLYSACTTDGRYDGQLWCSLSSNFDNEPRWTYCEPSDPAPCNFPFTYRNKSYYSCTKDGSVDGQLWCATTSNYDRDSKWKAC